MAKIAITHLAIVPSDSGVLVVAGAGLQIRAELALNKESQKFRPDGHNQHREEI